ncbi:alpha/beta fold hydrolase [Nonomuraea sp. NBC_00507]|uniref:alpha/beta fold hydrolase n=1 Tax=Nonomuraea sp. NBC_00507 TaxID=2976002 RepID=UPI002E1861C4
MTMLGWDTVIHGLVSDSNDWNWLTPLLRDRYRIVSMDMRGHGRSSLAGPQANAA